MTLSLTFWQNLDGNINKQADTTKGSLYNVTVLNFVTLLDKEVSTDKFKNIIKFSGYPWVITKIFGVKRYMA